MTFDLKKLLREIDASTKHRVPEEQPLFLVSLDFASNVFALKGQKVTDCAHELNRVAEFYYRVFLDDVRRPAKRGRRKRLADVCFIYAMAILWAPIFGTPRFRKYRNARVKQGERGGAEDSNIFQEVCNAWMRRVDPKRPKPMQPAAFKTAGERYRRHRQGK